MTIVTALFLASCSEDSAGSCDSSRESCRDAGTTDGEAGTGNQDAGACQDPGCPDADAGATDGGPADAGQDAGAPLKAFPSAFGGGAASSGGRGGVLIVVNSSDPTVPLKHFPATAQTPERYEGGLYSALQFQGPAYVIFDRSMNIVQPVGGTGNANAMFPKGGGIPNVRDKTVFGQSAPKGGITITGGTFRFDGTTADLGNLIFRYFRGRPIKNKAGVVSVEDDAYTWGLLFYGGHDIIVDHCSFSFAQDKGAGAFIDQGAVAAGRRLERLTFSRNLIADAHTGLYVEINPDRPMDPEKHVDQISFIGNAIAGINRTPNVAFDGYAEILNSVIYTPPYKATTLYHDLQLNHIGNYYFRSDGSTATGFSRIFQYDASNPRIFTERNYFTGLLKGVDGENNQAIFKYEDKYSEAVSGEFFVPTPFQSKMAHSYTPVSAAEAFASLITKGNIGANRYLDDEGYAKTYQDSFDSGVLATMRAEQFVAAHDAAKWVLPTIPETARPSSYDTDHDGMADAWEMRTFGDLTQSYDGDYDADGYTNIEEYMNQVDEL
ncbi:MAG: hypothetical protein R3B13_11425 [Polyangiaceae bacterium]